jgi:thiosulfate reductase cytochrome b subunit
LTPRARQGTIGHHRHPEDADLTPVDELAASPNSVTKSPAAPEHSRMVRVTHWVNTVAFIALIVSGIAILLAHPRLYWGDAGNDEMPALVQVPVPLNLRHSGWGRSLHFLGAWVTVLNGLVYVGSGLLLGHFRRRMSLRPSSRLVDRSYHTPQKLVYLAVIFALLPLLILTGLTMSPAVTAAYPSLVAIFAGRQSARTLHFFLGLALVLFLVVHLIQVARAGFVTQVGAMLGRARR